MAFFEQIRKRITDAGQGVAQQTKNLADLTRLNNSISAKEKKIAQLYLSIGQAYYQRHNNDQASEQQQEIEEIKTLFAEIAQCQKEIKQIKGVVKCAACGAEVPLHASFCNACGAKVVSSEHTEEVSEDTQICPNCGESTHKENMFCNHCGAKLEKTEKQLENREE